MYLHPGGDDKMNRVTIVDDEGEWQAEKMENSGARYESVSGVDFDLFDLQQRQRVRVSLARQLGAGRFLLTVSDAVYRARITERTELCPPGSPDTFGITAIAGLYTGSDRGSILIVVNCGHEPPTLQITARPSLRDTRSWSLQITHDIQHRILDILA